MFENVFEKYIISVITITHFTLNCALNLDKMNIVLSGRDNYYNHYSF